MCQIFVQLNIDNYYHLILVLQDGHYCDVFNSIVINDGNYDVTTTLASLKKNILIIRNRNEQNNQLKVKNMSLISRRNWALRLSIILNICVLLYVCVHFGSSGPWIDDGSVNWESQPLTQVQSVIKNANESQRLPGTITTNVEAKLTKTKSETNNKLPPIVKVEATKRIESENNKDNGVNEADANRPLTQLNQEVNFSIFLFL